MAAKLAKGAFSNPGGPPSILHSLSTAAALYRRFQMSITTQTEIILNKIASAPDYKIASLYKELLSIGLAEYAEVRKIPVPMPVPSIYE
ncbi:hypothetical protein HGG76_27470 [Ochrobactrum tritici]|uniref:Uncharacterized protein n=1 Tax=Brucella tritici TaxID=94626 RepID=A0A7X6JE84_9HYPH|nr:hypothetical protein [Brucella tritici]